LGDALVLLEIGKAVSFIMSILSLCALLESAFLVPGARWEERLIGSLLRVAFAGCVCFASGMIFRSAEHLGGPVTRTLPVRLFFWALTGMAVLFFLSWYLEEYYVPLLWRNQPH
jgi:hypothetical protein